MALPAWLQKVNYTMLLMRRWAWLIRFNAISVVDQNVGTNVHVNQNVVEDDFDNPAIELREIKVKNPNNQSLLYIVNFIRNKPSDLFTFLDCNNKNMFSLLQKQNLTAPFLLPSLLLKVTKNHFTKIETKIVEDYLYMSRRIYPFMNIKIIL